MLLQKESGYLKKMVQETGKAMAEALAGVARNSYLNRASTLWNILDRILAKSFDRRRDRDRFLWRFRLFSWELPLNDSRDLTNYLNEKDKMAKIGSTISDSWNLEMHRKSCAAKARILVSARTEGRIYKGFRVWKFSRLEKEGKAKDYTKRFRYWYEKFFYGRI